MPAKSPITHRLKTRAMTTARPHRPQLSPKPDFHL
jgi:hypothetical protein